MIGVDEAHRARVAPAPSTEELLDRLSTLIGRVVKIKVARVPTTNFSYGAPEHIVIGALSSLVHVPGSERIDAHIGTQSGEDAVKRHLKLNSEISVLTDGQWVVIHTPEERELNHVRCV